MATIDVKGLCKSFGHHEVISGFSLHVEDGEFLSLLGPSGCGKSTILRIVAGLEELTRGRIEIGGRDVTSLEPKDRNIAMVFQNYALYPRKTIFENLAYSLRIRNVAKAQIERRVEEVATVLQIEMLLGRYPSQLSGGQQQRVAMGRAMVREPAAFLFDEPLSNLDAKLRNHMRVEIRQLQKRLGTTTLYVTHDQVEAMTMSDRIVVLNQGRIEQIGRPLDIYERPASLFVARFIGSPAMNLCEASVDGGMIVLPSGHRIAAMRGLEKGRVTVGIRPERIKLSGRKSPSSLPFRISLVEELGSGKVVHGRSGDIDMIVAHPEDNPLPGGEAHIELQDGFLHCFDIDSGRRIDAVPLSA